MTIRLPMAMLGCISIFAFYKLSQKIWDCKTAVIFTLFLALSPWHIMKSRWALESNVFPELILYASLFILLYIQHKKLGYLLCSAVFFAFSAYSYGTSYFFLPFYILPIAIYMLIKRYMSFRHAVAAGIVFLVISLPIIIFVIINTFDFPQITTSFFTIPKLYVARHKELTSVFGASLIQTGCNNFFKAVKIIATGYDGLIWNGLRNFGIMYIFAFPAALAGIAAAFKNSQKYEFVVNFWFIAAVAMLFVVEPNINRINIIFIPYIYYTARGVLIFKKLIMPVTVAVIISFTFFCAEYFFSAQDTFKYYFFDGLEQSIVHAQEIDSDKIYITSDINAPYIYALLYTKTSPEDYQATVSISNPKSAFESVDSFGKYVFHIPDTIDENSSYIVSQGNQSEFSDDKFNKTNYGIYCTVTPK